MYCIVLNDDLGKLSRNPVAVFDKREDAENEIKKLERTEGDYHGYHGTRIYALIPISVHLSQHFFSSERIK